MTNILTSKVLILPKDLNAINYCTIKYRFPESERFLKLIINHNNTELFELNKYMNENASFFIDDYLKNDASVYFVTKIDPLLLLLPYFEQIAKIAFPAKAPFNLNDLLLEPQMENIHSIVSYAINKKVNLECVCDHDSDNKNFIFNENKTLKFLQLKFDKVKDAIKPQTDNIENCKWYAFDVLAPYLSDNLRPKLMNECGVNLLCGLIKQKPNSNFENDDNRNFAKKPKIDKQTKRDKKLQEAAKGSKRITSFFKKS